MPFIRLREGPFYSYFAEIFYPEKMVNSVNHFLLHLLRWSYFFLFLYSLATVNCTDLFLDLNQPCTYGINPTWVLLLYVAGFDFVILLKSSGSIFIKDYCDFLAMFLSSFGIRVMLSWNKLKTFVYFLGTIIYSWNVWSNSLLTTSGLQLSVWDGF